MSVALLLISDGRTDYLDRTLASAAEFLPRLGACVHVDDSDHELGFAGAIQAGWDAILASGCEWVFHLEADFTFNCPVPIEAMIATMQREPDLLQIALKRQAWNDAEKAAGGLVEAHPEAYNELVQRLLSWREDSADVWTWNRRCFTTNPCLYSTALCHKGWPQVEKSEGIFTHELLAESEAFRFGLWGPKYGPPWVTHIGDTKTGKGY